MKGYNIWLESKSRRRAGWCITKGFRWHRRARSAGEDGWLWEVPGFQSDHVTWAGATPFDLRLSFIVCDRMTGDLLGLVTSKPCKVRVPSPERIQRMVKYSEWGLRMPITCGGSFGSGASARSPAVTFFYSCFIILYFWNIFGCIFLHVQSCQIYISLYFDCFSFSSFKFQWHKFLRLLFFCNL